jgi:hypothetical protein
MKRLYLTAILAVASLNAHATGRLADVSIVDGATGAELPTHYYRGEYWVAGTPGARYAISVRNHLGERLLAVMSVDGVNVLSGDTASWDQTGYVFGSRENYQIHGWRKSNSEVAAFEFSAASGSYASLTGRPANVGVIGVALFRERIAPAVAEQAMPQIPDSNTAVPRAAPSPAPSQSADAASSLSLARRGTTMPQEKLGTAHGEREQSYVVNVEFARRQTSPDEMIRIRYDSVPNLIALGVIQPAQPYSPLPNPFPAAPVARYVPDP